STSGSTSSGRSWKRMGLRSHWRRSTATDGVLRRAATHVAEQGRSSRLWHGGPDRRAHADAFGGGAAFAASGDPAAGDRAEEAADDAGPGEPHGQARNPRDA